MLQNLKTRNFKLILVTVNQNILTIGTNILLLPQKAGKKINKKIKSKEDKKMVSEQFNKLTNVTI